jgi:ribosomal protein S8E
MFSSKKIILYLTIIIAGVASYAYYQYNKKVESLRAVKADINISAVNLATAFAENEAAASQEFVGKNIAVTGSIINIENSNDSVYNIVLGNDSGNINCLLDVNFIANAKQYSKGETASIVGYCTGYLMDVELNRCYIPAKK